MVSSNPTVFGLSLDRVIPFENYGYQFITCPVTTETGFPTSETVTQIEHFDHNLYIHGLIDAQTVENVCLGSKFAEDCLISHMNYAAHIGYSMIIIPLPKSDNLTNLASVITNVIPSINNCEISFKIDMGEEDSYRRFNSLKSLLGHAFPCFVSLDISEDLPSFPSLVTRWKGEHLNVIYLSSDIFVRNKGGYPVLPVRHQDVVKELMLVSLPICLKFKENEMETMERYIDYLDHLKSNLKVPVLEEAIGDYCDFLQNPLQPLMDNLESSTYKVFEQCPVKYAKYEEAIYKCLMDKITEKCEIHVAVVGAGRGPLVRRAVRAYERVRLHKPDLKFKVFALEKNRNAFVTLQGLKKGEWKDQPIEIIFGDMRNVQMPQVDILVSELLGSFGDNELSPECLDGAIRFLKDDGVSIPQNYTSFITPLSSTKLYKSATNLKVGIRNQDSLQIPYVVYIKNGVTFPETKKVWDFEVRKKGGIREDNSHNTRYSTVTFESTHLKDTMLLHGFAGYFESVLYKDVKISINQGTADEEMTSWFPMYFPIRSPISVKANEKVKIHMWRKTEHGKVWYEWAIQVDENISMIHNARGFSYFIGL
jgi:protein arginine N-methyltransferase 5